MNEARALSARTRANRISISARSSTEVGSSSRMTRWPARCSSSVSALASSTIWRVAKPRSAVRVARVDRRARPWRAGAPPPRSSSPASRPCRSGELRLVAEIDVLADGEVGEQRLLLEHHADALPVGIGGLTQGDGLAGEQDLAGVRLIDAGQDLHQRRLAGAVLADQADHLVRADLDATRPSARERRGSACRRPASARAGGRLI